MAQGIRSVVELMVRGAESIPGAGPALFRLARLGDDMQADLIQTLLAHLDPDRMNDEPYSDDKRPEGYYQDMYAAVGRVVANPT